MYIYHIHNIGGQLFSAIEVCFYKLGLLMFIIVETPFFFFPLFITPVTDEEV